MSAPAPELVGTFGMVSSTHWLVTAVAMSVLERGGNAFDAAVAGGFALHAAQPHQNSPGGEVPAVFYSAAEKRTRVLAAQGTTPAGATIDAFASLGLTDVPGTGLLAATVPGAVGGWLLMLQQYGTWTLRDVLEPAIGLLATGIWAGAHLTHELASVGDLFGSEWSTSEQQWGAARTASARGELVKNPELAATYERLIREAEAAGADRSAQIDAARDAWYSGFVAEAIDTFSRSTSWLDTSGARHSGLLTGDDLAGWRATFEDPATVDYHGVTVAKTGAWGQGPVFLQQLRLLEGYDLGSMDALDATHVRIEASKLAFADREAWYSDTTTPDQLSELLSPEYAARRRALISESPSTELRAGAVGGVAPRLAAPRTDAVASAGAGEPNRRFLSQSRDAGAGEPNRRSLGSSKGPSTGSGTEPAQGTGSTRVYGDTCHIDVVDSAGNMVSATPSGGWLQSSPAIPGLGFCLGTRAQMFWLEPGLPGSLLPNTRPRTTLSPGLALRDGVPWMAFGTPGGDTQDQWSLGFFLGVMHGGGSLRAAMDAPRVHSEHTISSFYPRVATPNRLVAEADVAADLLAGLTARGHDVVVVAAQSQGKVTAVTSEGGLLRAVADTRIGEPYAAGR